MRAAIQSAESRSLPDVLPDPPAFAYGEVNLAESATLHANLAQLHVSDKPFRSETPLAMEQYGTAFGIMEYWYGSRPQWARLLLAHAVRRHACAYIDRCAYIAPCMLTHASVTSL